jgi:hypothetical protein
MYLEALKTSVQISSGTSRVRDSAPGLHLLHMGTAGDDGPAWRACPPTHCRGDLAGVLGHAHNAASAVGVHLPAVARVAAARW